MRHVVVFTVVLGLAVTACGHPASTGPTTGGTKPGGGSTVVGTGAGRTPPAGTAAGSAAVPSPRDLGCPAPTCAFHPGAGAYFSCTSSGGGSCFHFGPACTPVDACMFDPADRAYKSCAKAVEGTCRQWGTTCAPANACMFSPQDGYHHRCEDVSGGTCKRYGAFCAP